MSDFSDEPSLSVIAGLLKEGFGMFRGWCPSGYVSSKSDRPQSPVDIVNRIDRLINLS